MPSLDPNTVLHVQLAASLTSAASVLSQSFRLWHMPDRVESFSVVGMAAYLVSSALWFTYHYNTPDGYYAAAYSVFTMAFACFVLYRLWIAGRMRHPIRDLWTDPLEARCRSARGDHAR